MGEVTDPTPQLLERWHGGEVSALDDLVALHLPWLRQRAEQRLGELLRRQGEADDYVHDAMLDFLRD